MPKFTVVLREVWDQTWEVEAKSKQEACDKARDGNGNATSFEYNRTLDGDLANDVQEVED